MRFTVRRPKWLPQPQPVWETRQWYAWYPVCINRENGTWAWLEWVVRHRIPVRVSKCEFVYRGPPPGDK